MARKPALVLVNGQKVKPKNMREVYKAKYYGIPSPTNAGKVWYREKEEMSKLYELDFWEKHPELPGQAADEQLAESMMKKSEVKAGAYLKDEEPHQATIHVGNLADEKRLKRSWAESWPELAQEKAQEDYKREMNFWTHHRTCIDGPSPTFRAVDTIKTPWDDDGEDEEDDGAHVTQNVPQAVTPTEPPTSLASIVAAAQPAIPPTVVQLAAVSASQTAPGVAPTTAPAVSTAHMASPAMPIHTSSSAAPLMSAAPPGPALPATTAVPVVSGGPVAPAVPQGAVLPPAPSAPAVTTASATNALKPTSRNPATWAQQATAWLASPNCKNKLKGELRVDRDWTESTWKAKATREQRLLALHISGYDIDLFLASKVGAEAEYKAIKDQKIALQNAAAASAAANVAPVSTSTPAAATTPIPDAQVQDTSTTSPSAHVQTTTASSSSQITEQIVNVAGSTLRPRMQAFLAALDNSRANGSASSVVSQVPSPSLSETSDIETSDLQLTDDQVHVSFVSNAEEETQSAGKGKKRAREEDDDEKLYARPRTKDKSRKL